VHNLRWVTLITLLLIIFLKLNSKLVANSFHNPITALSNIGETIHTLLINKFHPIFLLGFVYKFFTKVLAIRLRHALEKLTSSNQLAFIKGRFLVDRVITMNNVVDLAKRACKNA
jgi:hypothetical protein